MPCALDCELPRIFSGKSLMAVGIEGCGEGAVLRESQARHAHVGDAFCHSGLRTSSSTVGSCELRKRGRTLRVQQQPLQLLADARGRVRRRRHARTSCATASGAGRRARRLRPRHRQGGEPACGNSWAMTSHTPTMHRDVAKKRGYRFVADVVDSSSRQPGDADARESYLKARYFWNERTPINLQRSIEHFRCTIERAPDFAHAWTGLADAYVMIGIFGLQQPREVFVPARTAAQRALALDDALAEAHTVLADIPEVLRLELGRCGAFLSAGHCRWNPSYAVAHQWYTGLLSILGRHDEAWTEIETARRCEPLSVPINAFFWYLALQAGRYEAAVDAAHQALELDTNAALTHDLLGRAYARLGDTQKAIESFESALRLGGSVPLIEGYRGYAYARAPAHVRKPSRYSRTCVSSV